MLRLHTHDPKLDHYNQDPAIPFPGDPRPRERDQHLAVDLDHFSEYFEREATLHFGSQIQAGQGKLVKLVMHLESFLFPADGATTPQFAWISRQDALGAVVHALAHKNITGSMAVIAPKGATRAELQQLLLRRGFLSYIRHRMFRVMPLSRPGRPAGMNPELAEMRPIADTDYSFLDTSLASAMAREFGKEPHPPDT